MRLTLTAVLFFLSYTSFSQVFGGTPPSQKWLQINTDTARVIFPEGLDSQANRVATIVHALASQRPYSIGNKTRKINIVLHHRNTIPNAYVGLGPFRSEFGLTPDPMNFDQGSIPWTDQLAVHEYRHVQQFSNFNNGLSRTMEVLFGEDGYALASNAAVPDWFFEGDAVNLETLLSGQGRGRLPHFLNAYPSLWRADKKYSWMKLRNGSLKDYVPSHYHLGYLLVNYGREKYGIEFWEKVTRDASAYKSLFYPFQAAIKKHAGVEYDQFRKEAFDFYRSRLTEASSPKGSALAETRKSYVTNYFSPYPLGGDSLIYLKNTYRHRPAFYLKYGNEEKRIRIRDISIDNQFSYRNGRIVYASYHTDSRWGWREYSVLNLVDVQTGQQKRITRKSRYFSPDISNDGSRIVAVHQADNGRSELHVLDASTGEVLKTIHSFDIGVFTDPRFIDDNRLVTAVRLVDGKMALAVAEITTGITTRLTTPSLNIVGNPSVYNGMIYFTAGYQGNDDIFVLRLSDNKISRITQGPLGNYFVNAANGKLSWSAFTAEGYQPRQMDLDETVWYEVATATMEKVETNFAPAQSTPAHDHFLRSLETRNFPGTRYPKGKGLINLHSWRPNFTDPEISFTVYGQNILNTLQTELYYLYDIDEKTNAVGFNAVYAAWFPYLVLGSELTFDRKAGTGNSQRSWNQIDSRVGLNIPIRSSSGRTYKNFSLASFFVLRNEFNEKPSTAPDQKSFGYLSHSVSWLQQVARATQHIYPRWAFSMTAGHRHAISRYEGYQFFGSASIFVPGLLSTHNIILTGAFQQRDTSFLLFANRFAEARGYEDFYPTNVGSRLTKLSVDYHFPLFYPDWGFGNILYLQRLRANLFYDFQKTFRNNRVLFRDMRSVGAELFVDTKWWNQYPLSFGIRWSHLLDDDLLARRAKGSNVFEFILPLNIIPR